MEGCPHPDTHKGQQREAAHSGDVSCPQVQTELRRMWRSRCPSRPSSHSLSFSRAGSESALHFPRGSRAPSFLQTETSVI